MVEENKTKLEKEMKAPKGVPPTQMASAIADKVGKDIKVEKYDEKKDTTKVEVETKKVEETKTEDKKDEVKVEDAKVEDKAEDKKDEVKTEKKVIKKTEVAKKDVAIANGVALRISPKQSKYVCRLLVGKSPDAAVARLQAVLDERRPVPMAGLEVGHKKGKGLAGGKWPKNACKAIMEVVKQAGANAVVNGIEAPVIRIAKADRAAAPLRKGGRKAKRAHVHIEVIEKTKLIKRKNLNE